MDKGIPVWASLMSLESHCNCTRHIWICLNTNCKPGLYALMGEWEQRSAASLKNPKDLAFTPSSSYWAPKCFNKNSTKVRKTASSAKSKHIDPNITKILILKTTAELKILGTLSYTKVPDSNSFNNFWPKCNFNIRLQHRKVHIKSM